MLHQIIDFPLKHYITLIQENDLFHFNVFICMIQLKLVDLLSCYIVNKTSSHGTLWKHPHIKPFKAEPVTTEPLVLGGSVTAEHKNKPKITYDIRSHEFQFLDGGPE